MLKKNNLLSNNSADRNSVYGRTYFTGPKENYGSQTTMKSLKNKHRFSKNKDTYGSHGQYTIK